MRECLVCQQNIFFCATKEDALLHAEQEHIVALQWIHLPEPFGKELLRVKYTPEEQETWAEAWQELERVSNITDALHNVKYTSRRCANCSFPVPEWWKKCRVCGNDTYKMKSEDTPAI